MLPKIKFDQLITIDDWAAALQKLLDAAAEATENEASDDRLKLQSLLLTYIKKSPPSVESLDAIARQANDDLGVAEISASLNRIKARSADLQKVTGMISAVAAEAKKDARALRLEGTFDALSKAKAAVDALNKLEKSLASPDQTLLAKLKAVGEAINDASALMRPKDA